MSMIINPYAYAPGFNVTYLGNTTSITKSGTTITCNFTGLPVVSGRIVAGFAGNYLLSSADISSMVLDGTALTIDTKQPTGNSAKIGIASAQKATSTSMTLTISMSGATATLNNAAAHLWLVEGSTSAGTTVVGASSPVSGSITAKGVIGLSYCGSTSGVISFGGMSYIRYNSLVGSRVYAAADTLNSAGTVSSSTTTGSFFANFVGYS